MSFSKNKILEWSGVITAITYSLLIAINIGAEFIGFILLFASICEIDCEIFLILILDFGLIKFFCIRSQYIFNLDNPWEGAPTSSAFIIASEHMEA